MHSYKTRRDHAKNKRNVERNVARNVTPHAKQNTKTSKNKTIEIFNNNESFPSLKESFNVSQMSFASIAKKVEVIEVVKPIVSDVKPGWVHIRMNKGKIEYKFNKTDKHTCTMEDVIYEEKRLSKYLFTKRVMFQQETHDILNDTLGDLSPYWNTKTILQMHEDDDYQEEYYNNYYAGHSDSDNE